MREVKDTAVYIALVESPRAELDVTAIVAPVRYPGGVAGALSVLGPTYRIDEQTMHAYGRIVAHEAASLSRQLGDRPDRQET